jgi:hypothetical protein
VVAKVRDSLTVSKQTKHTKNRVHIYIYRLDLKKFKNVEGKKQYCVKISNRFAALENLDAKVDNNRAWET